MISLRKYLEMETPGPAPVEKETDPLLLATMDSYRAALLAMGKSAVQGSPGLGTDLEKSLKGYEQRLGGATPEAVRQTEKLIEVQLKDWGARTAEHFKAKADEVKELLIALAKTAESVGDRDQHYTNQFKELTAHVETIADLDDLTEIRLSLVARVAELKSSVDQMTRDSHQLVARLRAEVSTYESKLKAVEHLVLRDELTGAASRHSVEERILWNITHKNTFCVLMLDLNRFKAINDSYGHLAGDDMLKQFSTELLLNSRSGDLVGRWGGDEFIELLACDASGARAHIERIRQWVFGKYTLQSAAGGNGVQVYMDASIGLAEWHPGESMQVVIAHADQSMYQDKKHANALRA